MSDVNSPLRFWLGWGVGLALLWALLAWGAVQWNLSNYTGLVADRLLLLGELRRGALQEYFSTAEAELRFWSSNRQIIRAQASLVEIWNSEPQGVVEAQVRSIYVENNPAAKGFYLDFDGQEGGSAYDELHLVMHPGARLFVTQRGYYDFFLIGPDGDIYYTVEKEADFATNLETGPWQDTGLAQVYKRAKQERHTGTVAISDMQSYGPSGDSAAIFMATAIHGEAGQFLGVIAFQLPTDRILGIMAYTSGMGDTGETYLVGQDKLMRSDSRFAEESTVLVRRVDTPTVDMALAGKEGVRPARDYRDAAVMSAYVPIEVGNTRWAIMAEVDQAEIEQGAAQERPSIAGLLALFYSLSLWSVWYWRGSTPGQEGMNMGDLDFPDGDGGGSGD